ncbi:thymidylate synthase [Azospirillum argentinense]|uniref:thymidylate synthase n=1 Tax=Azospirillum argentinense TaxID=2970906 RepID=UPI00136412B4|nr:thymidylate synthase [Azospirillum argentinense]
MVFTRILRHGIQVEPYPTKGPNKELFGVVLELTQPLARVSRTESRGTIFSALGELFWYLSGSNKHSFIKYYIPKGYDPEENTDHVSSGYGSRIFNKNGPNQIGEITSILRRKSSSRRAVVQIYGSDDLFGSYKDVPCTCTMQFVVRKGFLHMYVNMRSNDAYLGLPHDIFAFTMIQELIARDLGVHLGRYKHAIGSLHLYDCDHDKVNKFMEEDWQANLKMPPMPSGEQWSSIETVLEVENRIRGGENVKIEELQIDDYWKDISRLFRIFHLTRKKTERENLKEVVRVRQRMKSKFYDQYIRNRSERLHSPQQLVLDLKTLNEEDTER